VRRGPFEFDARGAGLVAALALAAGPAAAAPWTLHEAAGAPASLSLSGSTRVRYEAIGGQARAGFGRSADLVSLRTILTAEYRAGPIRIGGEVYDSRAYGADRGWPLSTNEVNALEPIQAYVAADLGHPFGRGSAASLAAGRMTLNLGSRRLVAADDFRNTTNGYTGVRFDAKAPALGSVTVIYVEPQQRLPSDVASLRHNRVRLDRESRDLVLWGGVATRALPGKARLDLEYFGLDEDDAPGRPTRNRRLDTYGARLYRDAGPGVADFDLEALRQTGTVRAGTAPAAPVLEVSAGFVHAEAGYQFAAAWKPHISLEYDWVGGDHGAGRYNHFDTLFGMRGADFGPSGIFATVGRANLSSPAVRLEVAPSARLDAFARYSRLGLASVTDSFSNSGVRDAAGRSGGFAGQMVEGRVRYWIAPKVLRLDLNAVVLGKGRFLRAAPNAPPPKDTAYVAMALQAFF
jgi:hypothetical protein